jgi:FMN phosphatase YigB (HAD superfamily)/8-oxo-dGTP pyrophosphatase MutT (NUDIX family)
MCAVQRSYPTSIKGVLLLNGCVLLVRNPRDEWELPGGRIEKDEEHAEALTREFAEELSVKIEVAERIDSYLFEVIPGRSVFIVTYGCELSGSFTPALSNEHTDYCLWPSDRLAELKLPEGYRRSIKKWVDGTCPAKAVVFDLGGVLIDLHSEKAKRELTEDYGLSAQNFSELTRSCFDSHPRSVTELAMVGKAGTSEYLDGFLRQCRFKDLGRLRANRLSVIGRERRAVFDVVRQLKQAGVICCVLSNTTALHWERLGIAEIYPSLHLFDHIFASHLIGHAKPEEGAFRFVANALKVPMSECLLVDDTPLNVEGAKAVGWKGILFKNAAQLQRDLRDLLEGH